MTSFLSTRAAILWSAGFLLATVLGVFLRIHAFVPVDGAGSDELIYSSYVDQIGQLGTLHYPEMVGAYVKGQGIYPIAMLPPTRVTFILAASVWHRLFGVPALESLRSLSCAASVILLMLSAVWAWRLRGRAFALALLLLMAVAPMQIYLAHWGLIDGFFALITLLVLWSLWEVLQNSLRTHFWLALYALSLTLLVLTKENAAFVYVAILGLLFLNRWLHFGRVSRLLLSVTVAAPLVGVLVLALCAGGFGTLIQVFTLNISKSMVTTYAIATGDGPWFRYLNDLLLVSPVITLFAIGGAFSLKASMKSGWYFFGFIFFSYICMCNVTYGMNLRYASIWDFPFRFLALIPLFLWTQTISTGKKRTFFLVSGVGLLSIFELANYLRIFVADKVYDPVPANLLHALDILKF